MPRRILVSRKSRTRKGEFANEIRGKTAKDDKIFSEKEEVMKRVIVLAVVLVVVIIGGVLIFRALSHGRETAVKTAVKNEFLAIQDELKTGAKLYDVRTAAEFASGHFAGAVDWPVEEMQDGKLPAVAKTAKIYVYCRSGVRAGRAAQILTATGFTAVENLGGLQDVEKMGGELVKD